MPEEPIPPVKRDRPRSYEPVPMPLSVRWREFRVTLLPVTIFILSTTGAYWLWQQTATATGVAGMSEGLRSVVASPRAAIVQRVLVRPFQMVNAGDPVVVILPVDPNAELGLLQAELDIARLALQPSIAEDNAMNFEQIRVDLLQTKAELAMAKVNVERLENQVRRNAPLFAEKLVSEDIYDLSLKTRDMFLAEVFEKSNAVVHIEKRLEELQSLGLPQTLTTNSGINVTLNHLRSLRAQIATNWTPIVLTAPIAGMVSSVTHQAGETAIEGEPLVGINSFISERVVGYLRQPYSIEPEIGMEVVLVTRERKPRRFVSAITQVGAQTEIITNALAFIRMGALVDSGLPIAVGIPPGIQIRPGEILDLSFRRARANDGGMPGEPLPSSFSREQHATTK
ncbi:MAG TPA: hypothetical protein VK846_08490 [Candidatus Limnocylindria bacterium]|nr:hypothetical protein [Candidatus Limnocylindria bacterium]